MGLDFRLVWFDSFGAKSSCTLVSTPDTSVLIDPGIAIMHPSFPASYSKKIYWKLKGEREIFKASKEAELIVISHYHWDHFIPNNPKLYEGKQLFVKNPNEYINDSQRKRAFSFFTKLLADELRLEVQTKRFVDLCEGLESIKLDFLNYQKRREELLAKGRKWFMNRARKWEKFRTIQDGIYNKFRIFYPEGKKFRFNKTRISFTDPLFHGLEYSRVGWVFSTVIEYGKEKLIHSSDLNGPIIEDYANWIIKEKPTYLILDGPMTYMLGYTFNLINLRRVIENVKRIVKKVNFRLMVWDHHLPREPKFREHTREVWLVAKKLKKEVLTASEFELGKEPVVETKIR